MSLLPNASYFGFVIRTWVSLASFSWVVESILFVVIVCFRPSAWISELQWLHLPLSVGSLRRRIRRLFKILWVADSSWCLNRARMGIVWKWKQGTFWDNFHLSEKSSSSNTLRTITIAKNLRYNTANIQCTIVKSAFYHDKQKHTRDNYRIYSRIRHLQV